MPSGLEIGALGRLEVLGFGSEPETGSARVDFLGDGITDSPLVGRDTVGALTVGLAYNRSIFTEQTPDWRGELSQRRFALSIFRMAGSTRSDLLLQDSSAGSSPGTRDDHLDGASLQNGDTDFFAWTPSGVSRRGTVSRPAMPR